MSHVTLSFRLVPFPYRCFTASFDRASQPWFRSHLGVWWNVGLVLLLRISYDMWRYHAVCHNMYSVVGATSVRSLPELPQHGVSRRRAGAPDAGGYSNTESPGVSASVRSLSDTCLLTMFH